ncbi:MAG TPA: hypothetical protein VIX80_05670 [Candidatus Kapabacteria bacterium]
MKSYFLLLITSLFIIGCDSDSTTTNVTPGVADPFITGNYWVYQNTMYSSDGSIDSSYIDSVAITSTRVEGGTKIIEYSDGHSENIWDAGIWHSSPGEFWYQFPAKQNDVLYSRTSVPVKVDDQFFAGDISRYVSKVNDIITTPAGTFSTFQYYLDITKAGNDTVVSRVIDNFSPNIGLIKSELYTTSSLIPPLDIVSRKELIRYKLQ